MGMALKKIERMDELKEILNYEGKFLLFKHSLTCPISQKAFDQFNQYLEDHPEIDGYYLTVQESRPLSNYIEAYFSIQHESPQIFHIHCGSVKRHTSHENITKETINHALLS